MDANDKNMCRFVVRLTSSWLPNLDEWCVKDDTIDMSGDSVDVEIYYLLRPEIRYWLDRFKSHYACFCQLR